MKARVKKTGEIVELCDKQKDYFISTDSTPYKEEELEFGIIVQSIVNEMEDMQSEEMPIMFSNLFPTSIDYNPSIKIAIAYIANRKDLSPQEIENAVVNLMLKIKTLDSI